jgi:hypothetical protein
MMVPKPTLEEGKKIDDWLDCYPASLPVVTTGRKDGSGNREVGDKK